MNCVWDFISSNQDHFWYALSGIGAIGTLVVASKALSSWRAEKQYDLKIENLALCNAAVSFIRVLRSPVIFDNEIVNEEYLTKLKELEGQTESKLTKVAAQAMFVYQSRKDRQANLYEQMLKLREKNWAVYSAEHDFYRFFNYIIELDRKIMQAHVRRYHAAQDTDTLSPEEYKAIRQETNLIVYELSEEDAISQELNAWIAKLQTYRKSVS